MCLSLNNFLFFIVLRLSKKLESLNVLSLGTNFKSIRKRIISNIKKLKLKGIFYRKDIGWKVINKKNENY